MKRTTFILVAAVFFAVTLCIATTASAGTERYSSKEIAPAPVEEPFSWTGFYIGGNLGGTWSNFEFGNFFEDVDIDQQFSELPPVAVGFTNPVRGEYFGAAVTDFGVASFEFGGGKNGSTSFDAGSDDSFIGGGQIGFQKQFGHFVIGLEGDFDRASLTRWETFSASTTSFFEPPKSTVLLTADTDLNVSRRAQIEWMASARGRFGYAGGPDKRALLYATGGAAFAQVNAWANDTATTKFTLFVFPDDVSSEIIAPLGTITDTNVSRDSDILVGWTAGGGGEWAFNDAVTVGVEYRHSDFGSHTFHFDAHGGPIFPGPTKVDIENDMVVVKFNVLLNHFFGH